MKNAAGVVKGFLAEPLKQKLTNIVGGENEPWAVIELEADAKCKNGKADPATTCNVVWTMTGHG